MQEIWLLLKMLELCGSAITMGVHVAGFEQAAEPLPHNLIYCGTFFGFFLVPLVGIVSTFFGYTSTPLIEAIVNAVGAMLFFSVAILSMYNAEQDYHLMYLSDFEEPAHQFFYYCKWQSIAALSCAAIHLLHCVFAMDVLLIHDETPSRQTDFTTDQDDDENDAKQAIRLYVFGRDFHNKLMRYKWFQRLHEM